ncbi:cyclic nucleotide-binding domain-containing protein 1-like [Amphiura filiformis]|uniref:cyclic nucleotide-binding domain-containing protein 1-like n=1 Tax=Amphiura filiformis TaxID=82378 RepID=UPI003B2151AC
MALVNVDDAGDSAGWSRRNRQKTKHKIPGEVDTPAVDYEKLKWLCSHQGLKGKGDIHGESSEEAHKFFMENYHQIFPGRRPLPGIPLGNQDRSTGPQAASKTSGPQAASKSSSNLSTGVPGSVSCVKKHQDESDHPESWSHEIKEHLSKLHKERKDLDPHVIHANRIKELRQIHRKLPYERTAADNAKVYRHLKEFPLLAGQLTDKELKELCTVTQLDVWRDEDYTVFGNLGFHIILKGSVVPQTDPWIKTNNMPVIFRSPTPLLTTTAFTDSPEIPELTVGDCFGTLEKVEGREPNSKILTVLTKSVPCEFLKISGNDYKRITEHIRERENSEKVDVIQSCQNYHLWPRQSLMKLANLLHWTTYPENTVLVTEGELCPFVGFIKSGECHVLRQVQVMHTLPNGKQEKRFKQVVMSRLKSGDSFGEISVLETEPMTSSIVTATDLELGIISPERLKELDDTTRSLMLQSSEQLCGQLSEDEIHNEYIDQELKREWNQFKHGVVVDVINHRGIRPGYGKWSN